VFMPDVNILVYAHRSDEARHDPYKAWLEKLVNGAEPFALSVLVAVAFVRIVTNKRIFATPTPLPTALSVLDHLFGHPRCRLAVPAVDHWDRVAALCRAAAATGKLVADAQHAALAMAEGCTWASADRDFARFSAHGLRFEHLDL
jgi:uncharacterized protein